MDLAGREGILTPGTRQWQRAVLSVGLAVFCSTLTANRRGRCRPCLLRHTEKPRPRRRAEPARRTHRNPAVLLREWNFPAWRGHAHRQPTDVGPRTEGDVSAVNLAFGTPGPDAGLGAESGVPRRCPREASLSCTIQLALRPVLFRRPETHWLFVAPEQRLYQEPPHALGGRWPPAQLAVCPLWQRERQISPGTDSLSPARGQPMPATRWGTN